MTKAPLLVLIVLCLTAPAGAQTVRSSFSSFGSLSSAQGDSFSSVEGGYKIALPRQISGFREGTFHWRLAEGYFTVGYRDYPEDIEASKDAEAESQDQARLAIADFNEWLLESPVTPLRVTQKTVRLDNHAGIELRAEMPNGVALARSFPIKKRIYSLAVILVGEQRKNEAQALQVFDSFRVSPNADAEAVVRDKIAAAMPKPLPQEPVVAKLKSDAEDENLKGKVRATVEEIEGLAGRMAHQTRRMSAEMLFNEKGNRVKSTLYNSAGLPFDFTVYGYIDGKRVSSYGHISYESSPPPIMAPGGIPTESKPRDPRYAVSYVYKYDSEGRPSETLIYGNNAVLISRSVYQYSDHQVENLHYSEDGRLNSRSLAILDDNGNEVQKTYFDAPLKGENHVYRYSYEFDDHGNWTKRTATAFYVIGGVSRLDSRYITYRRITYY